MRETISSAQTFFMKFVFPCFWIGLFGMGTAVYGSVHFTTVIASRRPNPLSGYS